MSSRRARRGPARTDPPTVIAIIGLRNSCDSRENSTAAVRTRADGEVSGMP